MPTYLRPGVYIEEVTASNTPLLRSRPEVDPATAVRLLAAWAAPRPAVFIGFAAGGPVEQPVLVTSWEQFVATFEGHSDGLAMPLSVRAFFACGGRHCWILRMAGDRDAGEAMHRVWDNDLLLGSIPSFAALAMPDAALLYRQPGLDVQLVIHSMLISMCESRMDGIAVLDAPPDLSVQQLVEWRSEIARYESVRAIMLHPWLLVTDPASEGDAVEMPPSGAMAALCSIADPPIGLLPGLEPVTALSRAEAARVRSVGITPVRTTVGGDGRIDDDLRLSSRPFTEQTGARVISSIYSAIVEGTSWTIFRHPEPAVVARLETEVASFLDVLWRRGHLVGDTADAAYHVRCEGAMGEGQILTEVSVRTDPGPRRHLRVIHKLY